MKKVYSAVTQTVARFARWIVVAVMSFIVVAPVVISVNS